MTPDARRNLFRCSRCILFGDRLDNVDPIGTMTVPEVHGESFATHNFVDHQRRTKRHAVYETSFLSN